MSADTFKVCGAFVKDAAGGCARCGWEEAHHSAPAVASEAAPQKPSVGQIVHYVSHGTPVLPDGSQVYTSTCRAAIITGVYFNDIELTDLASQIDVAVLNPEGMFFKQHIHHDPGGISETPGAPLTVSYNGGSWHWPERV